ncbi:MAG: LuxR C-terminal-related transcriptional regulator [Chloroflexota bacterium]
MDFNSENFTLFQRPLLQTKLYMPRSRANLVPRTRLISKLNTALLPGSVLQPKLTLITGPAGYGKSTLAIQWINQLDLPVAWLSLDQNDNDEARFLAYLFAAVSLVNPDIGQSALARLSSTYLYNESEAILINLLNEMAQCQQTAVIVLYDFHVITSDAVHKIITFILQHAPIQLHLLITSRTEPNLPIALLRAQDSLNWINQQDLKFTVPEATQFLEDTMDVSLTYEQIELLDQQVEGWVTGLQLIGLALKESDGMPQAISGNHRYLVDYLADQVLNKQPEHVQAFLMQTAVLDRFCVPLCDALCASDQVPQSSKAILRHLETANLFLIPLDNERRWFRYHHLFGEFLNGRLHNRHSQAQITELHHSAAVWYHENGHSLIAVEHALTAQAYELAADIIRSVGRDVLMFGEGITLRQWMEQLPEDIQQTDPKLVLFHIWSLIRTGEFSQAKHCLNAISEQLDTPLLWGEWSALRARIAVMTGDIDVNIKFSNKALAKLPQDQHMLRSEVAINLGFSHLQLAEIEAARDAFAEAAQQTSHDPGLWAVMFATYYWGQTVERLLQLSTAFDVYQQGLSKGTGKARNSPALGFMYLGLGKLFYEQNQLAECETHLRQAVTRAKRCGDHKMLIYSLEALAQLLTTIGDWTEAQETLSALEQVIDSDGPATRRAILAIQQGELETVAQWIAKMNICLSDSPEKIRDMPLAYLTLVRYQMARNELEDLLPVLQTISEFSQERKHLLFNLPVIILQAIVLGKRGEIETAVAILNQAMSLTNGQQFVRTFIDLQDPTLHRLLHLIANNGVNAPYARLLLAHLSPDDHEETAVPILTQRELELVQYLAQGLTNLAISKAMTVSLNTVKAHTRRLYTKLDVHNRTEAVSKARSLDIL